ncbi:winged helix DNA-binding domain-containing protein [Terrimonas pollutisoli]|uniref:winged helix DNA-binding domain-containing protein n=1 Tax=Terrimonas pollutisoli TaxID=3034147 RepID=UPI0023ED535D|nr:winged helix DNA-binding domain-containing protein [Terrimonas sp. H1YJ31]
MNGTDIIRFRLFNQQIAKPVFTKPAEVVAWLVAMQAQEYAMAKWAIGLRLPQATDSLIETAFAKGDILRTHLMRPTWHFVTPKDIRWLLRLTAPRVEAINAYTYREQNLDSKIFKRSNDIIAKALEGGKQLMRTELQAILKQKKIDADGIRLSCLMMKAELEGIICSGARRGNQHTYALLDERARPEKAMTRKEALFQFTQRYFTSRGPATVKDFAGWSGLSITEAKEGAAMLPKKFIREKINEQEYIFLPSVMATGKIQSSFLMPDYDEYGMSYKDRSALFNGTVDLSLFKNENPFFNRMIILDGKIEGTWKRTFKNNKAVVETVPFKTLSKTRQQAMDKAIKKYCAFVRKGDGLKD